MKPTAPRGLMRRWVIAAAGAVMLAFAIVGLFRAPRDLPVAGTIKPPSEVQVKRVRLSEAALLDKTVLFLPSEWNTAQKEVKLPETSNAFAGFPAKLNFAVADFKLGLPPPVEVPRDPPQALTVAAGDAPFGNFGRTDAAITPLAKRGGYVEITAAGSGRRVLAETLGETTMPDAAGWQPMEFLAAIDASGLVSLDLTARSGEEKVDTYFSRYLAQTLRIGARLKPGFYRICVGP